MIRPRFRLWLLLGLLLLATFVSLSAGTLWLKPATVFDRLLAHDALDFEVWNHRLPRSLIAILAGAAFGLAGAIVRGGLIRNPLASPGNPRRDPRRGVGADRGDHQLAAPADCLAAVGGLPGRCRRRFAAGVVQHRREFFRCALRAVRVAIAVTLSSVTEFLILSHPLDINTALLALTGSLWSRNWHHVALVSPVPAADPVGAMPGRNR